MRLSILKRPLNNSEISRLVKEIRKFPNPLTDEKTWRS